MCPEHCEAEYVMTNVNIRKYRSSDRSSIVKCMNDFGDYLVALDSMKRQRRMPAFGESFTRRMLENVNHHDGIVYVGENGNRIIAFVAGTIVKTSKADSIESVSSTIGRVIELFVAEEFRGQQIGSRLMEKVEGYFTQKGCDVSKAEVFAPNLNAHRFYLKLGYQNRSIDMIKKL